MSEGQSRSRRRAPGPSARFATGRLLAGRYEILERIGQGGMAEVFRARDHRLDRLVAVKVLRPQYGQDEDARVRFAVEARTAAGLAVPNIVPVYDFGAADDGSLFIVMRLIDGPSLRLILAERGALPAPEASEIGRQVAHALAAAHEHGLVHRDVKPGNILLDSAGRAHLADFGVVKALAGAEALTRTGVTFGTAAYLAPEQASGGTIGPRTDIYALGVVLYESLAGRPPFSGDDPVAVTYRHAYEPPTPLSALAEGIDPGLERLVMACLAKDPRGRPASAQEVARALGSIAGSLAGRLPPVAAVGALASAIGSGSPAAAVQDNDMETRPIPPIAEMATSAAPGAEASTAAWARGRAAAAAESRGFGLPTGLHAATTRAASPRLERGVASPGRRRRRRVGAAAASPAGAAVLVLALALLVIAALALPLLMGDRDELIAGGPAARRTPLPTAAAILPADAAPTLPLAVGPTPEPTPDPTLQPTLEPTPAPTEPPTAQPTPAPTPELTPEPTEQPPPDATAEPPRPAVRQLSVRIPDRLFVGDYDGPGSGRYHGRSASWVYGQGTPYHTMTARFRLDQPARIGRRASLEVVGLDGENQRRNRIAVVLNGVTLYEGPNPLPNDHCCGPSGPGDWASFELPVPGDILQRNNELSISNLEPGECTLCPNFVMVDYAQLRYRVRPQ